MSTYRITATIGDGLAEPPETTVRVEGPKTLKHLLKDIEEAFTNDYGQFVPLKSLTVEQVTA